MGTYIKTSTITAGKWVTVYGCYGQKTTAFFQEPRGAQIKVRYGAGKWFGKDGQKQGLDGRTYKRLTIGYGSFGYARIQIKVDRTEQVTYQIITGEILATITEPF